MDKLFRLLIFASLLATLTQTAAAAGIQVSPSIVALPAADGSMTADLVVANPSTDVQLFTVSSDDFSQAIRFNPTSFSLEAGGRKSVQITVDKNQLQNNSNAVLATNISVVGRALANENMPIGAGVKIPLTIKLNATPIPSHKPALPIWQYASLTAGFVVLALLLWLVWKRKNRIII